MRIDYHDELTASDWESPAVAFELAQGVWSQDVEPFFQSAPIRTAHRQFTRTYSSRGQKFIIRWTASALPSWFDTVARGMVDLLTLPSNWNASGGGPVSLDVVNATFALIPRILETDSPAPWVVPLSDGGIQLEWHSHGAELEIVVEHCGSITGYWYYKSEGEEDEFAVGNDFSQIRSYIARIS